MQKYLLKEIQKQLNKKADKVKVIFVSKVFKNTPYLYKISEKF